MRILMLIIILTISACSEEEWKHGTGGGSGGSCSVCYETTNVVGESVTVCENDSGANCLTPV